MIAVVDYGVGNLFSIKHSLTHIGFEPIVSGDKSLLAAAEKIVLPGVGAFGNAAEKLRISGLVSVLNDFVASGRPLLGICLGMQLLFDESFEFGHFKGLGYLRGSVRDMKPLLTGLKTPQMGWNSLNFAKNSRLTKYIKEGSYVYYVHSFFADDCDDSLAAWSDYGIKVPGIVELGNVFGTQFHPEKSGEVGLNILKAFCEV